MSFLAAPVTHMGHSENQTRVRVHHQKQTAYFEPYFEFTVFRLQGCKLVGWCKSRRLLELLVLSPCLLHHFLEHSNCLLQLLRRPTTLTDLSHHQRHQPPIILLWESHRCFWSKTDNVSNCLWHRCPQCSYIIIQKLESTFTLGNTTVT